MTQREWERRQRFAKWMGVPAWILAYLLFQLLANTPPGLN